MTQGDNDRRRRVFRDPARQKEFDERGFVVVDFLESPQIERLREAWQSLPSDVSAMPFSVTTMSSDLEYRARVHGTVARELVARAEEILDDYRLCLCNFICKPAGESAAWGQVPLHQDWTFADESACFSMGLWIPLVDVDEGNGCLRVVPGSHYLNVRPRNPARYLAYPEHAAFLEGHYVRAVPMRAGEAFIYSQSLFHASAPNRSAMNRLAAGGLAIPREQTLLWVTAADAEHAGELALYRVDDAFYRRFPHDARPDASSCVGFAPDLVEPLSEEILHARLGSVPRT